MGSEQAIGLAPCKEIEKNQLQISTSSKDYSTPLLQIGQKETLIDENKISSLIPSANFMAQMGDSRYFEGYGKIDYTFGTKDGSNSIFKPHTKHNMMLKQKPKSVSFNKNRVIEQMNMSEIERKEMLISSNPRNQWKRMTEITTILPHHTVSRNIELKSMAEQNSAVWVESLKTTLKAFSQENEPCLGREESNLQIPNNVGEIANKNKMDTSPTLSEKLSFDSAGDSGFRSAGSTLKGNQEKVDTMSKVKGPRGFKPEDIPLKNIRNFSIIAHVDHGKSTLADRLLEMTGAVAVDPGNKQVLDKLQVERERGITVKAQTASLFYQHKGEEYLLNLIDTPGHVDFSNEVARSLAACQGVILLVDANQGVQAQTVANFYLALDKNLAIVPVLNKIDLKNANPDQVKDQLLNLFSIDPDEVLMISAKQGTGVDNLLARVVSKVPPPPGDRLAPLRALLFDSWFDKYRGAITLLYIRDGQLNLSDEICSHHTKECYTVKGLGMLRPHEHPTEKLVGGQVGYLVCNMRSVSEAHIGDTLHLKGSKIEPLSGFKPARPMVFAGVYPMEQSELPNLRSAIEKLALNDPGVTLTADSSPVLGQGWRVGFLGLLHLEVFNQRLEQEFGAEAIMTAPSVPYKVTIIGKKNISTYGGEEIIVSDPTKLPERSIIKEMSEPMVMGTIITPSEYINNIISECFERRGIQQSTINIDSCRVMMKFELPLNEIIVDFHDSIKSTSSGFASFDYEDHGFAPSDLVKLDILINGDVVDALSSIVHSSKATSIGRRMCAKLSEIIPRQMVQIAIQAAVGGKILARENIKAFRKDVTAKLYGGDVTRKQKLLKKQAAGKKRMRKFANINIPREAFIDYLKR